MGLGAGVAKLHPGQDETWTRGAERGAVKPATGPRRDDCHGAAMCLLRSLEGGERGGAAPEPRFQCNPDAQERPGPTEGRVHVLNPREGLCRR